MKKLPLIFGLGLSFICSTLNAQRFCLTFGGGATEFGYDVLATADGGFVIAGSTDSYGAGSYDFYVVKFDQNGNEIWTTTVGDAANEVANGITRATNGDYIVAGETNSIGNGGEMYVARLDSNGTLIWARSIGGNGTDVAREIAATSDNGCVVAGETGSYGQGDTEFYIAKLDANGTVQWTKTIGTSNAESAYGVTVDGTGNIIVAGRCFPAPGGAKLLVVKLDNGGNTVFTKHITSNGTNDLFVPSDVVVVSDGYVISGFNDTASGANKNSFLTKISTTGSFMWTRCIGTTGNDNGYSMDKTSDGGFIISSIFFGTNTKANVIKTDANGLTQWYMRSSAPGNNYSYGVTELNDGTFISVGNTDAQDGSDVFIMRIDPDGSACCGDYMSSSNGLLSSVDGTFGAAGSGGVADTIGTSGTGGDGVMSCVSPMGVDPYDSYLVKLYPNPTTDEFTIEGLEGFDSITITNTLGEVVYDGLIKENQMKLSASHLPAGVYSVNIRNQQKTLYKKLVIK